MRIFLFFFLIAVGAIGSANRFAVAQEKETIESAPPSCMEVEVDGERALSFSCMSQKLRPPANTRTSDHTTELTSESIALRPSNQLGLFNRAATSNRMGNTFGNSVYPQRPTNTQTELPFTFRAKNQ